MVLTSTDDTKAYGKDAANGWCVRMFPICGVAVSRPVRTDLHTVRFGRTAGLQQQAGRVPHLAHHTRLLPGSVIVLKHAGNTACAS
jgi:hypothetical protein